MKEKAIGSTEKMSSMIKSESTADQTQNGAAFNVEVPYIYKRRKVLILKLE